jgi:hypothetical protein
VAEVQDAHSTSPHEQQVWEEQKSEAQREAQGRRAAARGRIKRRDPARNVEAEDTAAEALPDLQPSTGRFLLPAEYDEAAVPERDLGTYGEPPPEETDEGARLAEAAVKMRAEHPEVLEFITASRHGLPTLVARVMHVLPELPRDVDGFPLEQLLGAIPVSHPAAGLYETTDTTVRRRPVRRT